MGWLRIGRRFGSSPGMFAQMIYQADLALPLQVGFSSQPVTEADKSAIFSSNGTVLQIPGFVLLRDNWERRREPSSFQRSCHVKGLCNGNPYAVERGLHRHGVIIERNFGPWPDSRTKPGRIKPEFSNRQLNEAQKSGLLCGDRRSPKARGERRSTNRNECARQQFFRDVAGPSGGVPTDSTSPIISHRMHRSACRHAHFDLWMLVVEST